MRDGLDEVSEEPLAPRGGYGLCSIDFLLHVHGGVTIRGYPP